MSLIREPENLKHYEITDKILNSFFKRVYPGLGAGFLEKVYHNALLFALQSDGLKVISEAPIPVYFEKQQVGDFFTDQLSSYSVNTVYKSDENRSRTIFDCYSAYCKLRFELNLDQELLARVF